MMLYLVAVLAVVGAAVGQRSPNADLVEETFQTGAGQRYSNNIVQDALLDVPGLVRRYGYPLEVHNVLTTDGYWLTVHRIPNGRAGPTSGPRTPVLLVHGLACSSADFLVLGPQNALAYILADAGYDVWLANARGNYYSRRHLLLNPDSETDLDFWRFSWDEIGNHDLPAIVNNIVSRTGQQKMHYIGHSQGTTAFFVLNSLRPQFNERFITFHALAPAVFVENNDNSIRDLLANFENVLEMVANNLGIGEVMGRRDLFTQIGLVACNDNSDLQPLCRFAMLGAFDVENFNSTLLPVIIGHNPAGAALRQIIHYSQVQRFKSFQRYNHANPLANLAAYGSLTPPQYDLSRVTVPTYLHYGLNDAQSDYRDVLLLAERLQNSVTLLPIERASFNHFDFLWGGDVRVQLYDKLVNLLRSADSNQL